MSKKTKTILLIFVRYLILLFAIMFINNLYPLFLFFNINPLNFILGLIYNTVLINNTVIVGSKIIEIIKPCIALSAYILLLILNLSIALPLKKRIFSLALSFVLLYSLNLLRIIIFSILFINDYTYFDFLHKFSWYFLSIILVILIWFLTLKIFKIKQIPIYTDIKTIINKN